MHIHIAVWKCNVRPTTNRPTICIVQRQDAAAAGSEVAVCMAVALAASPQHSLDTKPSATQATWYDVISWSHCTALHSNTNCSTLFRNSENSQKKEWNYLTRCKTRSEEESAQITLQYYACITLRLVLPVLQNMKKNLHYIYTLLMFFCSSE